MRFDKAILSPYLTTLDLFSMKEGKGAEMPNIYYERGIYPSKMTSFLANQSHEIQE